MRYSLNPIQRIDSEERIVGTNRSRPAIALSLAALLAVLVAACGGGVEGGGDETAKTADVSGPVEGKLTISQWPLYIDPGKDNTISEFEGDTGVDVNYVEDINDNLAFFGKMQPQLSERRIRRAQPDHRQRLARGTDE